MEDAQAAAGKGDKSWWATLRFLLLLFLGALALRSLVVAPFHIPSASMLPTLRVGDFLFVAAWRYGWSRFSFPFGLASFEGRIGAASPERGDVAVFRLPGPEGEDFVKRVIGLPGDTVAVEGGRIVLNGEAVPRTRIADWAMEVSPNSPCTSPWQEGVRVAAGSDGGTTCLFRRYRETLPDGSSWEVLDQVEDGPGDEMEAVTVPEGHVFLMGDNRDDSLDSRFSVEEGGVGLVPLDHLRGPALVSFFSTDGSAEWAKPWTWFTAARWDRIGRTFR